MTEQTLQTVTTYIRWILIAGVIVLLTLMALLFWRKSHTVPVGEVTVAAPLTVAEAQQKVWFALPELAPRAGWQQEGVHVIGDNWVMIRYTADNGGSLEVGKGTKRPLLNIVKRFPVEARKTTTVNGNLAIFIQGGWDDTDHWNASIDAGLLEWTSNGFHYRIQQTGLGLNYQQMIDFGESLIVKPEKTGPVKPVNAESVTAEPVTSPPAAST